MFRESDGTRWIYAFYLALLVWIPIPLGSNRAWSWALAEIWILVLSMAWLAGHFRGRFTIGPTIPHVRPVLACMVVWVGYVWLQSVPLPMGLLKLLSPEAWRWHSIAAFPSSVDFAPLALDRHGALDAACKSTAYAGFFALGLALMRDRDRIRLATHALILSGVIQALYGAFTCFQNLNGWASGTFVNRNHYAAYLVMCLSVGIGVLIASLSGAVHRDWRELLRELARWAITPKMALRLFLVTMVVALVLSRSRMGNMAFFAALLVTGAIALFLSRKATRSMVLLIASLIAIDVFVIGAYFGSQRLMERIGETSLVLEDRDELAVYAIRMWREFPVFGAGMGSFSSVFPRYSAEGTPAAYTHAHNDYLEFAAEAGLVGLAPLAVAVVLSFGAALRAQYRRRDPVMRGVSFAAMMGILALMIHSATDFNLQIPAIALTFMQVLSFAWASLYCGATEGEGA